ncbi:MerR family transcriptional regulator [Kitasatospora paracochleata]|uniref:DNA-binding transcriptional MerR regulator n=1 Tax=Kitasatospora paracochleata TaxID=58354 RepID=A0ABT1J8W1_9ACTN|nr:MerR family transcriptional regulator [Kitasatospora paracochleata]MCP2313882.1 DNA-binding transcriptional MerR regulator [Kitasatospora paracochleata]
MGPDGTWSIGELAAQAGVTVKTVRFYSDRGLLPETTRSAGGHRRYGPEALERLRLIRSLRTLDLPVPAIDPLLDREDALGDALEDAIARQLRELGTQLAALRWREAALRLLHDCPPEERADRLRLIGAVSVPPDTTVLARYWRRILPVRLPACQVARIVDAAVPDLPTDPAPAQVLAFARLHATVTAPCPGGSDGGRPPSAAEQAPGFRPAVLYDGLAEAYELTAPAVGAGRSPQPGEALDCFVAAHAGAHGTTDSPAFRRRLRRQLADSAHPVMDRYWRLAGELVPHPTLGAAHDWLRAALDTHLEAPVAGR